MICMEQKDEKKLLDTIEQLSIIVANLTIEVSKIKDDLKSIEKKLSSA